MNKQQKEARTLIENWLEKQGIKPIKPLRHVYPRAYVIGHAASACLVIARPWVDAEDHLKEQTRTNRGLDTVHTFDDKLKAGMWCASAYVCHGGVQETVAVAWE